MKELSPLLRLLIRVWIYCPIALAGSVLIAWVWKGSNQIFMVPASLLVFCFTLLVMSKMKDLEDQDGASELLLKMVKGGFGIMLPILRSDGVKLIEGKHLDFGSSLLFDIGGPLMLAPFMILLPSKEELKREPVMTRFGRWLNGIGRSIGVIQPKLDEGGFGQVN